MLHISITALEDFDIEGRWRGGEVEVGSRERSHLAMGLESHYHSEKGKL